MAWIAPPPDVRRRVEDAIGDGIWEQLEASWSRVVAIDPSLRITQSNVSSPAFWWYRTPQRAQELAARSPGTAARYSQHSVGLAIDVTPAEAHRESVISEARRQGFYVRTYTGRDRHIHVAALSDKEWARSSLLAYLRALQARRD
jgi:hypothetical protein